MVDKMGKYEMDSASIVEDTERTRFVQKTAGQKDGRPAGPSETSIHPLNFVGCRYNYSVTSKIHWFVIT